MSVINIIQQEVACLETERSTSATEDEERVQCQKRLECYEQRMRDLEMRLMERTRHVDEEKECYHSLRQKLHQFNILLNCRHKRQREKVDRNRSKNDSDNNNDTKTANSSVSAANPTTTTVDASSSAVKTASPSAATSKTLNEQSAAAASPSAAPSAQPSKQEQQQRKKSKEEIGAKDKASRSSAAVSNELSDPLETSSDCIDAPPGINQEPIDRAKSMRLAELHRRYIRIVNRSSEEMDVGEHYIVQLLPDGPSAVFQFPVSVPLPSKATVTIWSAASGSNRHSPPTDFVFFTQNEWLMGTSCTTILCKPNQEAIESVTSFSAATIHSKEEVEAEVIQDKASEKKQEKREEERKREEEGMKEEEKVVTKKRSGRQWEDCEDVDNDGCPCEKEESSSDNDDGQTLCDCEEEEEEEECAEEEDVVDCWWGEKRCSLDKTIPCASVHLDDCNSWIKVRGQQVSTNTACRGHEVNERSSSISLAVCDEGRHQKPITMMTTTKNSYNCENKCMAPPKKKKSSKMTVPSECSSFVPTSGVSKKKSNGCRYLGLGGRELQSGKTKSSNTEGCSEGQRKRKKTLRDGVDELDCPCACRQSDSFAVTAASLMAASLTVAAMYCA